MKGQRNQRRGRFLELLESRDLFAGLEAEVFEIKEALAVDPGEVVEEGTSLDSKASPDAEVVVSDQDFADGDTELFRMAGWSEAGFDGDVAAFAVADDFIVMEKSDANGEETAYFDEAVSDADGNVIPIRFTLRGMSDAPRPTDDGEGIPGDILAVSDGPVLDGEVLELSDDSIVFMTLGGVLEEGTDPELPVEFSEEIYQTSVIDDTDAEVVFVMFNSANIADTNWDGEVSPIDVLITSNAINRYGSLELTTNAVATMAADFGSAELPYALDANDDGYLSPADVGVRVNRLNALAEVTIAPLASSAASRMMIAPSSFLISVSEENGVGVGDRAFAVDDSQEEGVFDAELTVTDSDAAADRMMGIMIGEPIWQDELADEGARKMVGEDLLGEVSDFWVPEEVDVVLGDWE